VTAEMDCYEALNEQQVDLAQQLKALVAPVVQVGGSGRRFDTSHCVGSPLRRPAFVLLYNRNLCAWERGLNRCAAASSSVERWMTSGLVHKGWHQAQCLDVLLSSVSFRVFVPRPHCRL
jgi:hypothetical protein